MNKRHWNEEGERTNISSGPGWGWAALATALLVISLASMFRPGF